MTSKPYFQQSTAGDLDNRAANEIAALKTLVETK